MIFSGVEFAYFLPVALALYWLVPRRAGAQNAVLLVLGYLFYFTWSPRLVPLFALATLVDYAAARFIAAQREAGGREGATPTEQARRDRLARLGLGVSLAYNLGQLCLFKYLGFFAESLAAMLATVGVHASLPVLHLALPLGISFYTFQKIAYVVDVYDGKIPACRSPLTFATFVAFFPQLIAGPIVRGDDTLPQLAAPRRPDAEQWRAGAGLFLLGFVKKAYVADFLARYVVDPVFADPAHFSARAHWLALAGYGVQVFCDFSGYSEMAIGTGRLFGVELPKNFDYPLLAKSLPELWRRWHITLNTWLFEYVFGPLTTGTSWLRGRLDAGFLVVFLASGLWHGARATFVVWGLVHGLGLVVHHRWDEAWRGLCRKDRAWVARRRSAPYVALSWALTQAFFLLSLVPFRSASLGDAARFARGLLAPHAGPALPAASAAPFGALQVALCFALFAAYHLLEIGRGARLRDAFFALHPVVRGAVYGAVVALLLLLVPVSAGTFIYAQF